MATPDILITPGAGTMAFTGSVTGTMQLRVAESGALHFEGDQGSLLTITDDLSDSLFSVNDAAGMPVFEVFADDTIKSYRNNESKLEIDPDNNRIRLRDNTYISGDLIVSGDITSTSASHESTSYTASTHVSGLSGYFGKVGIGTTHFSEPTDALTVGALVSTHTKTVQFNSEGGGEIGLKVMSRTNRATIQVGDNDTTAYIVAEGGIRSFGSAQQATSSNLSVLANGAVGIGTILPDGSLLRVNGDVGITGQLSMRGVGVANVPALAIDTTNAATFIHSAEAFAGSMTAGQSNIIVVGKEGTTKNAGYIGYEYQGAGSDNNTLTLGHWGSNYLVNIKGDGSVGIGTTTPVAQLNLFKAGSDDGISSSIYLQRSAGHYGCAILQVGNGSAGTEELVFTAGHNNNPVAIGNAKMTVGTEGVGIGTRHPDGSLLSVNGTASITGELRVNSDIVIPQDNYLYFEGDADDALNRIGRNNSENAILTTSRFHIANIIDSNNDDTSAEFSVRHNGTTIAGSTSLFSVNAGGASTFSHGGNLGGGFDAAVYIDTYNSTGNRASSLHLRTSRNNTVGVVAQTVANDYLGTIAFQGVNSSSAFFTSSYISAIQSDGAGGTYVPSDLVFVTSTNAAIGERMRIRQGGEVGIGCTGSPGSLLAVNGDVGITGAVRAVGQIRTAGGALATPSFGFTNDAGLGMSRPTTQALNFITSSTERVRINSAGEVGINTTTTAGSMLRVNGDVGVSGELRVNRSGLFVGGSTTTNARVGIGTLNPGSLLEIYESEVAGNTQLHIHNDKSSSSAVLKLEGKRASINDCGQVVFANNGNNAAVIQGRSADQDGAIAFLISAPGTASNCVEAMRISNTGNVGIGTNNPQYKLEVASSTIGFSYNGAAGAGTQTIKFEPSSVPGGGISKIYSSYAGAAATEGRLALGTYGEETTIVMASGKVGIGTSNPLYMAHLKAAEATMAIDSTTVTSRVYLSLTNKASNDYFYFGKNGGTHNLIANGGSQAYAHVIGGYGNSDPIQFATNNTVRMSLIDDGYGRLLIGEGIGGAGSMLAVSGDVGITGELRTDGNVGIGIAPTNAALQVKVAADQNLRVRADGSALQLTARNDGNSADIPFYLRGSLFNFQIGNVGIGTVTPSSKLHVASEITCGADDNNRAMFGYTPSRFYLGTRQSSTNYLDTVSVTDGCVGIGTSGPDGKLHVYQSGDSQPALLIEGSQGSLFSVEDSLTGSLMSVNDIAGLPVFEAFDDGTIVMGQYNSGDFIVTGNKVGIGTANPQHPWHDVEAKLHVNGDASITGELSAISGRIFGGGPTAAGYTGPLPALGDHSDSIFQVLRKDSQIGMNCGIDDINQFWIQSQNFSSPIAMPLLLQPRSVGRGGVGIGCMTHAETAGRLLSVKGAVGVSGELKINNASSEIFKNADCSFKVNRTDQQNIQLIAAGRGYVQTSAALGLRTNGANLAMLIDTSQHVGIGTTAIDSLLTIRNASQYKQDLKFVVGNTSNVAGGYMGAGGASENIWISAGAELTSNPQSANGFTARNNDGGGAGKAAGIRLGDSIGTIGFFTASSLTNASTFSWDGGSEAGLAMIINNAGDVGIGTTNPNGNRFGVLGDVGISGKLSVNGAVHISPDTAGKDTFRFTTNASNDGRILMKSDTTTNVDIQANGVSYFKGGDVGIGTTNPNGNRFGVLGDVGISGNLNISAVTPKVTITSLPNSAATLHIDSTNTVLLDLDAVSTSVSCLVKFAAAGGDPFYIGRGAWDGVGSSHLHFINGAGVTRMVIQTDGLVGIGTSTPSKTLHVHGAGHFNDAVGIGTLAPSGILHVNNAGTGIIVANNQITGNAFEVHGAQGNLLTITDDLSDSLMSVNDAAGMPVFEVFADDTIKSYRNNESKFEVDPDNSRIRLRDEVYISGHSHVSGTMYVGTDSDSVNGQSYIKEAGLNLQIKGNDNVQLLGDGEGLIAHFDYTSSVGINTTTVAGNTLTVNGDVGITGNLRVAAGHGAGKGALISDGTYGNSYASFSNAAMNAAGQYAVLHRDTGHTMINAATSQRIDFRINNANKAAINKDGDLEVTGLCKVSSNGIRFNDGTTQTTAGGGGGAVTAVANGSNNRIATFSSSTALNGESTLTYDGSDLTIARRLAHDGDVNTYIAFDADNIKMHSHGVDFLEVSEGTTDELIVNPGEVDVNFRVKGNGRDELLFADAGNDRVGVLTSAPTTSFQVNGTMYVSGNSTMRGNVTPQADDSFYLGAADKKWKKAYFENLRLGSLSNDATAVGSTTRFLVEGGSNEVEYQLGNEIIYACTITNSSSASSQTASHGGSVAFRITVNDKQCTSDFTVTWPSS